MSTRNRRFEPAWLLAVLIAWPVVSAAQVPVDDQGSPIGQTQPAGSAEDLAILTSAELQELIGPVALYPDDLLAIVLPASTYPLQIVEAARFIENLETDSSLKPDDDWDDSVVALTNYPEVVKMMNDDLDWTWRLGEAVVAQQTDVISAIEAFRDRAYASGNLKSDDFQTVTEEDGAIQITPVKEDVIYVPYYEPERVVVYQPRPVYYYYPRPYPVYYYPYPLGYSFYDGYFWGVTTAFSIGWPSLHLHVWHSSYYGHPYYGSHYWYNNWWYRRPDIRVYNNYYVNNNYYINNNYGRSYDRYRSGDYWRPQTRRTIRSSDQRITRTRYYPNNSTQNIAATTGAPRRSVSSTGTRSSTGSGFRNPSTTASGSPEKPITFRSRTTTQRNAATPGRSSPSGASSRSFASRSSATTSSPARPSTASRSTTVKASPQPRASLQRPTTTGRSATARTSSQPRVSPTMPTARVIRPSTSTRAGSAPSPLPRQNSARSTTAMPAFAARSPTRSVASAPSAASRSIVRPSSSPSRSSFSRPSQPSRSAPSTGGSMSRSSASPSRSSFSRPSQSSRAAPSSGSRVSSRASSARTSNR